jgi:putative methyltransferase (TIGR04325 family)
MWSCSLNKGNLNVLDFGGALGTSYFQNRKFLNKIDKLKWNIIEQKHYVKAGRELIQDEILKFYENIEECCHENELNVAIFSGVLDIIKNPDEILEIIIEKEIQTIIIDRSTFITSEDDLGEDKYVLQIIPPSIYKAVLPFRHISYIKLKNKLENSNYKIIENFPSIGGKGKGWEFRGLIAIK